MVIRGVELRWPLNPKLLTQRNNRGLGRDMKGFSSQIGFGSEGFPQIKGAILGFFSSQAYVFFSGLCWVHKTPVSNKTCGPQTPAQSEGPVGN